MKRLVTEAMRNQFDSTYKMITNLVNVCPTEVWLEKFNQVPVWHQVYHFVFFIDFWLRDRYDASEFRSMIFDEKIRPEISAVIDEDIYISQSDIIKYLEAVHVKTTRIFDRLNDELIGTQIMDGSSQYTYADVIIGQIRHIMYNIGYLNGFLRQKDLPESDWYAYNEKQ